jgi:hypothetical protein
LGLASDDSPRTFKLREAEIKHGRLAMVAFLGAHLFIGQKKAFWDGSFKGQADGSPFYLQSMICMSPTGTNHGLA